MMAANFADLMRARFVEATAEVETIEAVSAPLRAQRDDIRAQMAPLEAQERALNAQIRDAEAGLFELKNEIGGIVRALKGKTSAPGEEPPIVDAASPQTESDEGAN